MARLNQRGRDAPFSPVGQGECEIVARRRTGPCGSGVPGRAPSHATVFHKGNSPFGYALNLALTVFIFAGILVVLWLLPVFDIGWLVIVKLATILFFVPTLIRYIRRAKPGTYDPLNLPADALPAL